MQPSAASLIEAQKAALRLVVGGKLDRGRLERGYDLAKAGAPIEYNATANRCNCADAIERDVTCKHQIAIALLEMAREIDSWLTTQSVHG